MKILLVYSPRPYWPFLHEQDNFMVPQNLVYLAGAARKEKFDVKISDCMPLKIGYKSLERLIREYNPDIVAVGENHALYAENALQVCRISKSVSPKIKTIVGGTHFSNTLELTLADRSVDFIVIGEGEAVFVNLLKAISGGSNNYEAIRGIAFHPRIIGSYQNAAIIQTPPERLIENLDNLGIPAYDLLRMDLYGKSKYLFSPGGTTIHHGRGCTGACPFCAFWVQMADRKIVDGKIQIKPRYRTRSPEMVLEEVEILKKDYGKSALVFVDETFNLDPNWSDVFAEGLLKRNLNINFFAFMRADLIVRDEMSGIMEKLVRAGLRHVCVGVERSEDSELKEMKKTFYSSGTSRQAFEILNKKYPEVFRQATFIVGIRDESKESMKRLESFVKKMNFDFPAFHPLTPVPGTPLWEEAKQEGWLEVTDFNEFDWSTPVMPSKYLSRYEIEDLSYQITRKSMTLSWYLKGIFSPHQYRRRMYIWWSIVSIKVFLNNILRRINPFKVKSYHNLVYPEWYDK